MCKHVARGTREQPLTKQEGDGQQSNVMKKYDSFMTACQKVCAELEFFPCESQVLQSVRRKKGERILVASLQYCANAPAFKVFMKSLKHLLKSDRLHIS